MMKLNTVSYPQSYEYSLYTLLLLLMVLENQKPTMRDLNRYVTKKHATDWYDIGIELGLELELLDIIKKDNPQQSVTCFQKTLDKWLKLNGDDTTWKTLEVALTNVNRANLKLRPVDDVYGNQIIIKSNNQIIIIK